jgi:hypothetical protein
VGNVSERWCWVRLGDAVGLILRRYGIRIRWSGLLRAVGCLDEQRTIEAWVLDKLKRSVVV